MLLLCGCPSRGGVFFVVLRDCNDESNISNQVRDVVVIHIINLSKRDAGTRTSTSIKIFGVAARSPLTACSRTQLTKQQILWWIHFIPSNVEPTGDGGSLDRRVGGLVGFDVSVLTVHH